MKAAFPFALCIRILRGKAGTARYLRGAVLGIALSLVPLLVVMEVSTGMIEGITARLIEIGTYHLQITLPSSTDAETLERASASVRESGEVTETIAERQGVGLLFSNGQSAGVTVRFIPPDLFTRDAGLREFVTLVAGSADLGRPEGILLGAALAEKLGVRVGDTVILLTPYTEDAKGPPKITPLNVVGTFQSGYQEMDMLYAYAPLGSSWSILSPRASLTLVGVKVRDPLGDLTPVVQDIRRRLAGEMRIYTWMELEYARLKSFQTTKAMLLFIMAMIVLVAAVNVSSSVIMITFERRYEIGILKSVGAGPANLALSFLMAGFVTGFLGTLVGVALGLAAAVNINELISGLQWVVNGLLRLYSLARAGLIPSAPPVAPVTIFNSSYYLASIPIRISWGEVCLAAAGTLALSGIASYLPAARAARVRPLEVIRKV
jgi:lipoprotein-releasing system permease protein